MLIWARPGVRRGPSGSFGSFGRTVGVVGFIPVRSHAPRCRRVHSFFGGSIRRVVGVAGFIPVRWFRLGAPWGSSDSLSSFGRAVAVVGFIRSCPCGHWFRSGSPWRSSGFFSLVLFGCTPFEFMSVRQGGRRVHSGSLGSFMGAMAVVGFRWVNAGAWSDSFGFVGLIRTHPEDRRVHSGWLGSSGGSLGVVGFVGSLERAMESFGFVKARPWVVVFIWVRWAHSCAPWEYSGSFRFVASIRSRLAGRRVHSGVLGSLGALVWFFQVRWVHSAAPWGSSGSFVFVVLIRAGPACRRVD